MNFRAIKPQIFKEAALQSRFHVKTALHLSVAAGIRSQAIAHWLGTQRVVRAMPNTPALVGKGMTALFSRDAVGIADRERIERVIKPTGSLIWLGDETQLDAVTALSGSGPAYVFYFIEAMIEAGVAMGLTREQVYITNIVKYRPPQNRDPHPDEKKEFLPYRDRHQI